MVERNFMDEIDCGSFFDHIDDLLEFPGEEFDAGSPPTGLYTNDAFPAIWTTSSDSIFSGNSNSDLSAELSVPIEDIVQLEWLSTFVDDSFSRKSLTINEDELTMNKGSSRREYQTSSPVSVLEISSSCSGEKTVYPTAAAQRGRARSKRPRPATFNPPRPALHLISPTSSKFAESRRPVNGENPETKMKKKKIELSFSVAPLSQPVRKCMHCEITKTPQWRAGPMGPKTLCNACGVRYKSGRLFPEYRPAASPTFIPSVHSNSHKKVLEIRNTVLPSSPELIPNTNSGILFDYV